MKRRGVIGRVFARLAVAAVALGGGNATAAPTTTETDRATTASVPWWKVGPGWSAVTRTSTGHPHSPLDLYLISPGGTAYRVAVALAISGIGAGVLQTVGPAIAAEKVHPEERGDALALTGTFRATALFLSPLAMAGLVTLAPVTAALLAAGLLITAPAATTWRSNRDVD